MTASWVIILFTPVVVEGAGRRVVGMGLGADGRAPDRQRQGIGSQLVRRGLDILRERGCPFVVVVGHPEFYPRFGFEPASTHGLVCQWEGMPDAAFMVLVLDAHAMAGVSGVATLSGRVQRGHVERRMIVVAVLALAVLDSVNPSAIVVTLYLLSVATRARVRVAVYIGAIFVTYLALGVLMVLGLDGAPARD